MTMENTVFNGELGFWDYLTIAFYTKFRPSKLVAVGPARATIWSLPACTDEIEAADWSLTPGRYVGVAPPEVDEDFDFEQTLKDIHLELADLNRQTYLWLELGMQSMHGQTLELINRRHDHACTVDALYQTLSYTAS